MSDDGIIFSGDTEFGSYEVVDTIYGGRPARVLYSGNRLAVQSGVARDNNPELLFDYNQRFFELLEGIKPRSVLVLGGGAFTLPSALMHEFPNMLIDVVELDGGLLDIAQSYFDFQPSKNVSVHIGDGLKFLNHTTKVFDMIIVDVYFNTSIPKQFTDLKFARSLRRHLRRHLSRNGVVAINVISALHGLRSMVLRRLHEALQAIFLEVTIFPASPNQSPWIGQNLVLTAQSGQRDITSIMRYAPLDLPPSSLSSSFPPKS